MKSQIIVARYNEDISYLLPYSNIITVYNKGDNNIHPNFNSIITLPNIGRETHSYLYHIIQNYDFLAENTLFMQGYIDDHNSLTINKYLENTSFTGNSSLCNINVLKKNIKFQNKYIKDLRLSNNTPYFFINNILGIDIRNNKNINIVWGAIFSVHKDLILEKPLSFYKNILKYLEDFNPEEGHFMERSWYLIYNSPSSIISKNIITYYFIENNEKKQKQFPQNTHLWSNNIQYSSNIKYINTNHYIPIFPIIDENNSFTIQISHNINILLDFDKNNRYEIIINNNILSIIHLLTNITICKVPFQTKIISVSWSLTELFIYDLIKIPIITDDNILIKSIHIKSNHCFIDYKNKYSTNLPLFVCNNENDMKSFYLSNYLDYYTYPLEL